MTPNLQSQFRPLVLDVTPGPRGYRIAFIDPGLCSYYEVVADGGKDGLTYDEAEALFCAATGREQRTASRDQHIQSHQGDD